MRMRREAAMMAGLGPPLFRVHITRGETAQKEKRKDVLSQFMAEEETLKY